MVRNKGPLEDRSVSVTFKLGTAKKCNEGGKPTSGRLKGQRQDLSEDNSGPDDNVKYVIKMHLILVLTFLVAAATAQQFDGNDIGHEDVHKVAAQEDLLPPHLKNPFYQDPRIRSALSKSSWFGPGERPVQIRDTNRIPRREIFIVLKHAGLLAQQQANNGH